MWWGGMAISCGWVSWALGHKSCHGYMPRVRVFCIPANTGAGFLHTRRHGCGFLRGPRNPTRTHTPYTRGKNPCGLPIPVPITSQNKPVGTSRHQIQMWWRRSTQVRWRQLRSAWIMRPSQNSGESERIIESCVDSLMWFDIVKKIRKILDFIESHITRTNRVNDSMTFVHIWSLLLQGQCAIWIRSI